MEATQSKPAIDGGKIVMKTPVHTLRTIFAVSILLASFWTIGLAWELLLQGDGPFAVLAVLAGAVTGIASWLTFRGGRLGVASTTGVGELVRMLMPRVIGAYCALVPMLGSAAWLLTRLFFSSQDPESDMFVVLMAIWLPLWTAPALGAGWTWRSMRRRGLA